MTTISLGSTSSASQTRSGYQWVYGPLNAQSISGTCSCDVRGKATTFINLFFARVAIWVAKPDGTSRGTLFSPNSSHNSTDWSTSFSTYNANVSLSSVSALAGDYLVYEVGQCREAFVDVDSSAVEIGDTSSSTRMEFTFSGSVLFWAPAGLTYDNDNQRIKRGTAITNMNPSSTGGPITTYAIQTGALPPGVTINSGTGVISGTPTSNGTYTWTVRATGPESQTTDSGTLTMTVYAGNSIRFDRLTEVEVKIGG
jgi:hypothetical protein